MTTTDDTNITVSTEAIHNLAQEMVEKVISAQKKEVDEMIKEAESYVAKLKSAINMNNAIVEIGDMAEITKEDEEVSVSVKRAAIKLDGVNSIDDLEKMLLEAKKRQTEYNELIEQFKKYCSKMHGSADEIEQEIALLMEEIDLLLESEEKDSEAEPIKEDTIKKEEITKKDEDESSLTLENILILKALFEEHNIPFPKELEQLLKEKTTQEQKLKKEGATPIPTATTPLEKPTETEMPPVEEEPKEVTTNTGYYHYEPVVEAPQPAPEPQPAIDTIVSEKPVSKIPTSSPPIAKANTQVQTKSSGGATIATTSGVAAATILGLGAKAYLDKKKENEIKEDENLLKINREYTPKPTEQTELIELR